MRFFFIILTGLFMVCSFTAFAQWATTSQFTSINSPNTDGLYPTNYTNVIGNAQLTIGANWTNGWSDLSLINSNIGNTAGGGFGFWQMTGASSKKMLAYLRGDGRMGIGIADPVPYALLQVHGPGGITTSGNGAEFRFRDQNPSFPNQVYLDEWTWSGKDKVARFGKVGMAADILKFDQYGQVGIFTSGLPESRLDVSGETKTNYLTVRSQDGAAEGGEISLAGSVGSPSWQMDVFNNTFRLHTNGTSPLQIFPNGNVSASGNLGVGTANPSTKLHVVTGGVTIGNNIHTSNVNGHLSIGDITSSDEPTPSTWTNKTTFIINAQTYSTIGFADVQNSRVDYIRAGSGTIELGYDAGWGRANIGLANGIWRNDGNVGIGTTTPGSYKLAVEGKIGAREVEVKVGSWADFVFQPDYQLRPLSEVADFVTAHKHLPEIPSEVEVKENGISLGEMNAKLLQKIEELTLYMIEQQKRIEALEKKSGQVKP